MMKHTSGPWEYYREEKYMGCNMSRVITAHGTPIGKLYADRNAEHDGPRIVACIKACEGISTEALEAGVLAEILAASKVITLKFIDTDISSFMNPEKFKRQAFIDLTYALVKAKLIDVEGARHELQPPVAMAFPALFQS